MIIRRKKPQQSNPVEQFPIDAEEQVVDSEMEESSQVNEVVDFDILNNIDISAIAQERTERRRGDRRRGYRRVDDRNLISRAEEEARLIKENAKIEGFNQGLSSVEEQINYINNTMSDFLNAKERAVEILQNDLIELSFAMTKKLIKKQLELDNTVVLSIIAEVVKEIGRDEKHIMIKVHPDDEEIVIVNLPKLFPRLQTEAKILTEPDESVEKGSCIVQTKNGLIDARFSTQLSILQNAFKERL